MSIVYVSCVEIGYLGLRRLLEKGLPVSHVISVSDNVARRHKISGFMNFADLCREYGINLTTLESYKITPKHIPEDVNLMIVNGWNRLISQDILNLKFLRCVGLHAGHPPLGHGRAPIPWNIIKGNDDIEVFSFALAECADAGDIYASTTIQITQWDDAKTVYEKVTLANVSVIMEAVEMIERDEGPRQQSLEYRTFYPKRTPDDGKINFNHTAKQIFNLCRALTEPYPGAFGILEGEKWTFDVVIPFDCFMFRDFCREPGRICAVIPSGLVIMTGTETILLKQATVDGIKITEWGTAKSYLEGKVFR